MGGRKDRAALRTVKNNIPLQPVIKKKPEPVMGEQAPEIREVFKYETAFQGERDREENPLHPGWLFNLSYSILSSCAHTVSMNLEQ